MSSFRHCSVDSHSQSKLDVFYVGTHQKSTQYLKTSKKSLNWFKLIPFHDTLNLKTLNFVIFFYFSTFDLKKITCNRDSIPEENQNSAKPLPMRGHQLLTVKQSPKHSRNHHSSMQTASLLSHNTSSDSDNSDVEKGKLMKPKQHKKNFSLGEASDDDEDQEGLQMKRTWAIY